MQIIPPNKPTITNDAECDSIVSWSDRSSFTASARGRDVADDGLLVDDMPRFLLEEVILWLGLLVVVGFLVVVGAFLVVVDFFDVIGAFFVVVGFFLVVVTFFVVVVGFFVVFFVVVFTFFVVVDFLFDVRGLVVVTGILHWVLDFVDVDDFLVKVRISETGVGFLVVVCVEERFVLVFVVDNVLVSGIV